VEAGQIGCPSGVLIQRDVRHETAALQYLPGIVDDVRRLRLPRARPSRRISCMMGVRSP
jgi:hypothetical protein